MAWGLDLQENFAHQLGTSALGRMALESEFALEGRIEVERMGHIAHRTYPEPVEFVSQDVGSLKRRNDTFGKTGEGRNSLVAAPV